MRVASRDSHASHYWQGSVRSQKNSGLLVRVYPTPQPPRCAPRCRHVGIVRGNQGWRCAHCDGPCGRARARRRCGAISRRAHCHDVRGLFRGRAGRATVRAWAGGGGRNRATRMNEPAGVARVGNNPPSSPRVSHPLSTPPPPPHLAARLRPSSQPRSSLSASSSCCTSTAGFRAECGIAGLGDGGGASTTLFALDGARRADRRVTGAAGGVVFVILKMDRERER